MWGVDGDKTVGISDTIRITDTGCESFFDLPMDFTVADSSRALSAVPDPRASSGAADKDS
jgi:Xaa-Pro dipeptidase